MRETVERWRRRGRVGVKRYNNCTGCEADYFMCIYTTAATGPK